MKTAINLRLKHDAQPKMVPPSRVPYSRIDMVSKEINKWIKDKITEPIQDVRWVSLLTPVFKDDGSLRLCADFKDTVNPALEDFDYPISRIIDLIAKIVKREEV
ncbi:unnamed protein product [Gordionus sp. m RMFG-2023]